MSSTPRTDAKVAIAAALASNPNVIGPPRVEGSTTIIVTKERAKAIGEAAKLIVEQLGLPVTFGSPTG